MSLRNASSPIVVGTRVRATITGLEGTLNPGDLGTVVAVTPREHDSFNTILILMDEQRQQRTRTDSTSGVTYHWSEHSDSTGWDVVTPVTVESGGFATITTESISSRFGYNWPVGTLVNVGDNDTSDDSFKVWPVAGQFSDWKWALRTELAAADAPATPETLAEFRVRFMVAAHERGVANGRTHSAQVTEALDNLARVEYLDPSPDLDSFKRRVVALAMEAKAKHTWCPEPETFLRGIGLGDLLPVKKTLRVVVEVEVDGSQDWDRAKWRAAAKTAAQAAPVRNMSVPVSSTTVRNAGI